MWEAEAETIFFELSKLFQNTKDSEHFSFLREFKNKNGETYLTVRVAGYKYGNTAQYDVEITHWYGLKIRGYVKRKDLYINTDIEPTPKKIISYLNYILRDVELLKACTCIPSDVGKISEIHVIFDRVKTEKYREKTLIIPI